MSMLRFERFVGSPACKHHNRFLIGPVDAHEGCELEFLPIGLNL
jgi:hypothetical protein